MAVLSKIRQRSLLLILVIGFCLLAFIIGDIINSGGFGVSRNIGSVNGEDIPLQDYLQKVNDATQSQPGLSPTAASNAVWDREVNNLLFAEKFEEAGIRVGRDHVIGAYARNPQVASNPQFQNALGKFDRNKFNQFLADTKANNPALWQNIERNQPLVEDEAKRNIYITMIKAGMIATAAEGKARHHEENDKATFDYVYVPYSTVNDDEVKVSDAELIEYMQKNEKKYKAEASRDVEFVMIENKPSAEDEAEMKNSINALLAPRILYNDATKTNDTVPGFAQAVNVEKFVNDNSDIRFDSTYVTKTQLPLEHAEQIYNLAPGQVYGPYIDNGFYKLTRVLKRKAGANANVTHILVAYKGALNAAPTITRTKEEAKALADSYLAQVNGNAAVMAQLARTNSDDPGSVSTGGTYDVTPEAGMVQPFKDFALNNPTGKTGVVETEFGYHVMKINSKQDAVQLATVAQAIQPSEATSDAMFTKASKLEMDAAERPFADLAKELNLTVTPANKLLANDENVPGIGNQREIVRWAFSKDAEVGDVKKFDIPQGHVIVRLKNKNEKGLLSIEEAKQTVLPIIRDQKKAEKIKKKMEGSTLEAVSQKAGAAVATATDVTFAAPLIPNVGPEPKVVGTVFGLANGKTSGLIEGKMGVFMVRAKGVTKAADLPNYTSLITRMRSEARGGVPSRLTAALKEKAEIEDKRAEFN
jgi:peptidyl-prolyl cis-trans isomerase D